MIFLPMIFLWNFFVNFFESPFSDGSPMIFEGTSINIRKAQHFMICWANDMINTYVWPPGPSFSSDNNAATLDEWFFDIVHPQGSPTKMEVHIQNKTWRKSLKNKNNKNNIFN